MSFYSEKKLQSLDSNNTPFFKWLFFPFKFFGTFYPFLMPFFHNNHFRYYIAAFGKEKSYVSIYNTCLIIIQVPWNIKQIILRVSLWSRYGNFQGELQHSKFLQSEREQSEKTQCYSQMTDFFVKVIENTKSRSFLLALKGISGFIAKNWKNCFLHWTISPLEYDLFIIFLKMLLHICCRSKCTGIVEYLNNNEQ